LAETAQEVSIELVRAARRPAARGATRASPVERAGAALGAARLVDAIAARSGVGKAAGGAALGATRCEVTPPKRLVERVRVARGRRRRARRTAEARKIFGASLGIRAAARVVAAVTRRVAEPEPASGKIAHRIAAARGVAIIAAAEEERSVIECAALILGSAAVDARRVVRCTGVGAGNELTARRPGRARARLAATAAERRRGERSTRVAAHGRGRGVQKSIDESLMRRHTHRDTRSRRAAGAGTV